MGKPKQRNKYIKQGNSKWPEIVSRKYREETPETWDERENGPGHGEKKRN